MIKYTREQKEALSNRIAAIQQASGRSGNAFAVEELGFTNGSRLSHVVNGWDTPGLVGDTTWDVVAQYVERHDKSQGRRAVATDNLLKVWETCERAYTLRQACTVIGEGGYGKTFALERFKERVEREGRYDVYYLDSSMHKTRKQFVAGLMRTLGCWKAGTISTQLEVIRNHMKDADALLLVDEVSSLKDTCVTIIKDVMTALRGRCGIVFAGTPYFINNLNNGAGRDRHLYSETRDRLFMLPEMLAPPTDQEAEAVFKANGVTGQALDIVMGRNAKMKKYSIVGKRTYRGIADCIDMIRYVTGDHKLEVKRLEVI